MPDIQYIKNGLTSDGSISSESSQIIISNCMQQRNANKIRKQFNADKMVYTTTKLKQKNKPNMFIIDHKIQTVQTNYGLFCLDRCK